jgi:hypothetical protein
MHFHSTLKRSDPCLDFVAMDCDGSNEFMDTEQSPMEPVKKRSAAGSFGWDHYRAEEDLKASNDPQSWRNRKRSRNKIDPPAIITTYRVRMPTSIGIPSACEEESRSIAVEPHQSAQHSTHFYLAPKQDRGQKEGINEIPSHR